jgi:hypothetical protein
MSMDTDLPPISRFSPEWEAHANSLARSFAPDIHACAECGYPAVDGYCCTFCKCVDPRGNT